MARAVFSEAADRSADLSTVEHATEPQRSLALTSSACYRVHVLGRLGSDWSDDLGGMEIRDGRGPSGQAATVLSGVVEDQAALLGVLNRLYGLGFPLLSVELCPAGDGT